MNLSSMVAAGGGVLNMVLSLRAEQGFMSPVPSDAAGEMSAFIPVHPVPKVVMADQGSLVLCSRALNLTLFED